MHRLSPAAVGSYDTANVSVHIALCVVCKITTTSRQVVGRLPMSGHSTSAEGRSQARTLQFCFWLCAGSCMACMDSTQPTSSDVQHDCQMPACRLPLARVRWWRRLWRAVRGQCAAACSKETTALTLCMWLGNRGVASWPTVVCGPALMPPPAGLALGGLCALWCTCAGQPGSEACKLHCRYHMWLLPPAWPDRRRLGL